MRFGMILCLVLGVSLSPVSVVASENALSVVRKLDMSGKQRMLSQRMARAACFRAQGVQAEAHELMMFLAMVDFDRGRQTLRNGSEDLGIEPETQSDVLIALDYMDQLWPDFHAALTGAGADSPGESDATLSGLGKLAAGTLKASALVVHALETAHKQHLEMPELATLINVSGRLRTLSEKSAKEFCLLAAGADDDTNAKLLAQTVALFDTALESLMYGNDDLGVMAAPTEIISYQLEYLQETWMPLRDAFVAASSGGGVDATLLAEVATQLDVVLAVAEEAVQMYQAF